jgi:hypothetical protein
MVATTLISMIASGSYSSVTRIALQAGNGLDMNSAAISSTRPPWVCRPTWYVVTSSTSDQMHPAADRVSVMFRKVCRICSAGSDENETPYCLTANIFSASGRLAAGKPGYAWMTTPAVKFANA